MTFIKSNFKFLLVAAILFVIQLSFGCRAINFSSNGTSNTAVNESNGSGGGSGGGDTLPSLCRNAYYPVGSSVERKYHINYAQYASLSQDYTERFSDLKDDGFVGKTEFRDVNTSINWRCLTEGLLATQYANSIDVKGGSSTKIDTIKSEGISIPAESRWKTGEKWTAKYDIKETVNNPNGQTVGEGSGTVTQDGEILGEESVTVAAGSFQTMKVKVKTTLNLTVKVSGRSVPTKTAVDTISWFAKDVGMVRSENSLNGAVMATTELLSYKK